MQEHRMQRSWTLALFFAALASVASACSRGEAAPPSPARSPAPATPAAANGVRPRLVFFLNPNGAPCQMQDRILDEMAAELRDQVELVYYKTTNREDLAKFNEYGIRSLPQLVLTDPSGKELRRASPGIQGAADVRRLIGG
jgi:thioredoxin 1